MMVKCKKVNADFLIITVTSMVKQY